MSKEGKIEVKKGKEKIEKKEEKRSRELSIRRDNPFSLFQQMDRVFESMWRDFDDIFWWPFSSRKLSPVLISKDEPLFRTPLSNVTEDDKNFLIHAEMPGLEKGDIEISYVDGNLELKGEVKKETKEEKGDLIRREYLSSRYYRCFNLPDNIDADNIDAKLEKGILTVTIPKVEPPKPEKKTIEVK